MFSSLHLMFETEYMELALAVDEIAERIRALGVRTPASYREFSALATITEDTDTPNATEMVRRLEKDQEAVVRVAREVFPVAEAAQDQSTVDLLTRRMQIHEKTAWMLRSVLE
jgi:starvation-inducible DNA-binding protein